MDLSGQGKDELLITSVMKYTTGETTPKI